jgi:hypothetical protein
LLDAPLRAGFIQAAAPTRYVFVHPIIRQVFCQVPELSERQALHGRIARHLAAEERRDASLTRTIAYHGLFAGPHAPSDIDARLHAAADDALQACAWDDALLFGLGCLRTDEGKRSLGELGELHRKLAYASSKGSNYQLTQKHYAEALEAFTRGGDRVGRARVLSEIVRVTVQTETPIDARPVVAELETVLTDLGDQEPELQVRILDDLASHYVVQWKPERAAACAERGARLADQLGDARLRAQISTSRALTLLSQMQVEDALAEWQLGLRLAQQADDIVTEAMQAQRIPIPMYALGRLEGLERAAAQALQVSERACNLGEPSLVHAVDASAYALRAQLDEGLRRASEAIDLARRSRYPWAVPDAFLSLICCRTQRGEFDAARASCAEMADRKRNGDYPGRLGSLARLARALVGAYAGEEPDTFDLFARPPPKAEFALTSLPRLCMRVQLLGLLGRADQGESLRDSLAFAHGRGVVLSSGWPFLVQRLLGVACMLVEDWAAAREHLDAALIRAQHLDAQLEYAHALIDRARLAILHDVDRARARRLLDQARSLCDEAELPALARCAAQARAWTA